MDISAISCLQSACNCFLLGRIFQKIMMAPDSWLILTDGKISFPAHSQICAHIIGTVINTGNGVFSASHISPDHHGTAYVHAKICRSDFCQHHLVRIHASLSSADMKAFRFCNHICRVGRSVYRNRGHSQIITVRDHAVRAHHRFHLFLAKFPHCLNSQIQIRRIESIHHSLPVRSQPAVHTPREGGKKDKEAGHKAGA